MFDLFNFIRELLHSMLAIFSFGKKKLSNTLSVYVKTNTGSTLAVSLEPHMEIKEVKEMVAPQLGLEPAELKIIFAGRELSDTTTIRECDLGQQSIIHAVKTRPPPVRRGQQKQSLGGASIAEEVSEDEPQSVVPQGPLSETMVELTEVNDRPSADGAPAERRKAHFFVYCSQCEKVCTGKLRVRCGICGSGAFTVHRDPACWDDVLKRKRITGHCEQNEVPCVENSEGQPPFSEFFFKCSEHSSGGEKDFAAPLNLIKTNHKNVPCLACTDVSETILVFPCADGHVSCLDCFRQYCVTRLLERQFVEHPSGGYTLRCPAGCDQSFIEDVHHFKLLEKEQYERYQRFATEEYVLRNGGVLCPQPGCGMGLLVEPECRRIQCQSGCGYVFCRSCLQGYHLGECFETPTTPGSSGEHGYAIDPQRASDARWDEATKIVIKVSTKPCPKCRTATERDGGCMHMVCTRSGCGFEWCWVCQTEWTRDCMAAHWFG
ncbi:parkin (ubiquitin E3 ligase prkn) [Anopheles darlingi]|uniref:E3 ubiquitin-protein ligase parkin n=1 Tax=Anopheles darlingi TaxID=43151 RepID=W5JCJ4_ANODA|nr:parkin (ubiquitin E3 ligase prkn) [Anopheles darlingi]